MRTLLSALLIASLPIAAQAAENKGKQTESLQSSIDEVSTKTFLHGFRLGYLYIMDIEGRANKMDERSQSYAERYDMRSPHQMMIGYEVTWRMVGHDWLNVLLVGNVLVSGLEQSRFYPSGNVIVGFEGYESFQLGVGVSLTPTKDKPAHMLMALGWTPRIGDFYTPIHAIFVPDVDGHHRIGTTIGVNW